MCRRRDRILPPPNGNDRRSRFSCAVSLPNETVATGCRVGRRSVTCTESLSFTDLQMLVTRATSEIYFTPAFIVAGAGASTNPNLSPASTTIASSGAITIEGPSRSITWGH
jgi:hypothetical protein